MSSDSKPLVLYFGSVQRQEFYSDLFGQGVELGLLHDTDSVHALEPEEFAVIERMPFSDGVDAIVGKIEEIRGRRHVESVLNIDEALVQLWSEVCSRVGLPALSRAGADAVRSKSEMRRRFADKLGPGASTRSEVVASRQQAIAFAEKIGYPVVLKPSNLWGSYFVSRCANGDELSSAYREAASALPRFLADQRIHDTPAEIIVEEFMPGTNHSVECLALDGRIWTTPVIDVVTGSDLGGSDFHHFARITATRLTPRQQTEMRELACEAVRALDIDRGLAHVELVNGPDGMRLIEVGGRPGANRSPLLRNAYGINLLAGYRDVLRGVAPSVEPAFDAAAAVVTPYPRKAGILARYRGVDEIRALKSTVRVDVYKRPGDLVQPRQQGALIPMRIELRSDSPKQLLTDLDELQDICRELFVVISS